MKEKIRSTRLRMCFRKMPPAVCFLTLFALCFGALSVRAADPSGRVALTAVRMQRAGGQVYVSFAVKIAPRAVRARHRWVITPCLGNASDSVLLGPFVVTGRIMAREENQRRLLAGLPDRDVNHRWTARNGDTFLYTDTLRYAPWMENGLTCGSTSTGKVAAGYRQWEASSPPALFRWLCPIVRRLVSSLRG